MLTRALLRSFLLPAVERVTGTRFWSYYRQSVQFDRWEEGAREQVRVQRLTHLLNCARDSALHRQRLERAGLPIGPVDPADARVLLWKLPPVTKAELRRHFPVGVTTRPKEDGWRYVSTAGTTDAMTVIADFHQRDQRRGSELRGLRLALDADVAVKTVEIPPNACNIVCGLEDPGPRSVLGYLWYSFRRGRFFRPESQADLRGRIERRVVMPRHTLAPIEPAPPVPLRRVLDSYLEQIHRARPMHLRGFPIYLLWLADRAKERGLTFPGLKMVSPFGGLASPQIAQRLETGFGVPFGNFYGTSELGSVATACGRGPGMHLFEDLFIVDLFQRDQPAPPGEVGRIVITDLSSTAMPLIRYDLGDVGRLLAEPCPCGRRTARLEVLGRVQEVLASARGLLTASEVADAFFVDPHLANFRLEETAPGVFAAAVVAGVNGGTPDLQACQERFAALHGGVRRFRAKLVPFVQPESSGKYRFVHPAWATNSPAGEVL